MLSVSKTSAHAYHLLHKFRNVMKAKAKEEAKSKISAWYMHVGVTELNRFKKCVGTFVD